MQLFELNSGGYLMFIPTLRYLKVQKSLHEIARRAAIPNRDWCLPPAPCRPRRSGLFCHWGKGQSYARTVSVRREGNSLSLRAVTQVGTRRRN